MFGIRLYSNSCTVTFNFHKKNNKLSNYMTKSHEMTNDADSAK